mmetsp:Transcript_13246/g.34043  ORF Transcript_13246/g.34043 Transcript_13246/m.34043 type:complete len:109 (-) Transcript_13246:411-737(-)
MARGRPEIAERMIPVRLPKSAVSGGCDVPSTLMRPSTWRPSLPAALSWEQYSSATCKPPAQVEASARPMLPRALVRGSEERRQDKEEEEEEEEGEPERPGCRPPAQSC